MSMPLSEFTLRSVILAILLTIVLAVSNTFLALKLGILTSASIPAAILSMGILRLFKNANKLENNAVQTAASAGEAVAGGIVYTIPALIVIGYWHHFDYLTNVMIAASGGILGVLFSIPLRRRLVHDETLAFPEGRAIAEVLQSSSENIGMRDVLYGGGLGMLMELFQSGLKIMASSVMHVFVVHRTLWVVGLGFSSTLVGAGYLVGFDLALSMALGAVISWGMALPIASHVFAWSSAQPLDAAMSLWNTHLRYLGIGAMLFAGLWTLLRLAKPMANRIWILFKQGRLFHVKAMPIPRTERDLPWPVSMGGVILMTVVLYLFFRTLFPFSAFGLSATATNLMLMGSVMYVLVVGFFFSVITAYFSGMVGVTASPGSSVVIAGILFAAWLMMIALSSLLPLPWQAGQLATAEAMVMIIGSVVTGIAAIANDNTQDLKVGQLVGATPWKQELMLLLGVIVASLVIPPVMQVLFDVYGIAGVMPRPGMDVTQSLPAPTAAMFATITEAVFRHQLPFGMMFIGAGLMLLVVLFVRIFKLHRFVQLSMLGIGMGMYLSLTTTLPLFIGGGIAWWVKRRLRQRTLTMPSSQQSLQTGTRIACGLLAGASLLEVILAIPASMLHQTDPLRIVGHAFFPYSVSLSVLAVIGLAFWIKQRVLASAS